MGQTLLEYSPNLFKESLKWYYSLTLLSFYFWLPFSWELYHNDFFPPVKILWQSCVKVVKKLTDFFFETAVSFHDVELKTSYLHVYFLLILRRYYHFFFLLLHYIKNEFSFRVSHDNLYFSNWLNCASSFAFLNFYALDVMFK